VNLTRKTAILAVNTTVCSWLSNYWRSEFENRPHTFDCWQ